MPNAKTRRPRAARFAPFLVSIALAGCAGGVNVTPETVREAKSRWEKAGVRDYDLEWTSAGRQNAHYAVAVRDGRVRSVESVAPDGRRGALKPGDPQYYGVDGLFLIITEELAQLDQPEPFGRPRGSKAVLRFTPDPRYGYPRRFRRDVVGAPVAVAIDVVRFSPVSSRGGPAPTP